MNTSFLLPGVAGHEATVLMEDQALDEFLAAAVCEYLLLTPDRPVSFFALLLGSADSATYSVERVAFGRNARATDPAAREEFAEAIVPRFGREYEHETRGWWLDSRDLLKAARAADADGLEILGSIHMHPDWHRIGPPGQRKHVVSEHPTPMDRHMFANTCWPVNVICYLERRGDVVYHALAAWAPPPPGSPEEDRCARLPLRIRTRPAAGVSGR